MNAPTLIVALIIFGFVVWVIISKIRAKKAGKSGCSCGCDCCSGSDVCHPKESK